MGNLQAWQFTIDGLLVLSLFYLCLRVAKNSPYIQSHTLEASLRRLIQEAESSSQALNEKLVQRQTRLEELLLDLEGIEGRVGRTMQSVEEARGDLEARFIKAQRAVQGLSNQADNPPQPRQNIPEAEEIETPPAERILDNRASAPDPAPRAARGYAAYAKGAAQPAERPAEPAAAKRHSDVNIYGEPIRRSEEAPRSSKKSLAASVEKELESPYNTGMRGEDELQRVYDAAENMLRAGQPLESVAQATALPMDEVRLLSHMVGQERKREDTPRTDPRLGALGPVRRHVQTL